jgi:predicted RNase H-like HicB family nuclease
MLLRHVIRSGDGNSPERTVDLEKMAGGIMRQVVIYLGEDKYWVAECPSLPGCISQGKTKEEAISNIREAIQGYVAALEEDKLPVPPEHFDTILLAV